MVIRCVFHLWVVQETSTVIFLPHIVQINIHFLILDFENCNIPHTDQCTNHFPVYVGSTMISPWFRTFQH